MLCGLKSHRMALWLQMKEALACALGTTHLEGLIRAPSYSDLTLIDGRELISFLCLCG